MLSKDACNNCLNWLYVCTANVAVSQQHLVLGITHYSLEFFRFKSQLRSRAHSAQLQLHCISSIAVDERHIAAVMILQLYFGRVKHNLQVGGKGSRHSSSAACSSGS